MLGRVHALIKASAAVAVLLALGRLVSAGDHEAPPPRPPAATSVSVATSKATSPSTSPCGSTQLLVDPSTPCVPLPADRDANRSSRERTLARQHEPLELRLDEGTAKVGRLPERPPEWSRYQLPVELAEPTSVPAIDGAPGWVSASAGGGAAIQLVTLEGQRGDAEVVAVGQLRGITVVTLHRVQRGDAEAAYLVFYGRLARPGPSVVARARLGTLAVVGFLSDASAGAKLEFAVRELRGPLPSTPPPLATLESDALGYAVDPRNVIPLRP